MSKTIAEAITALAAKVKGSAVTPADGTKVAALDALVDAMAGSDVPMPQWSTVAEAIDLVTANYTPGGGGVDVGALVRIQHSNDVPVADTSYVYGDSCYSVASVSVGDVAIFDVANNEVSIDRVAAGATVATLPYVSSETAAFYVVAYDPDNSGIVTSVESVTVEHEFTGTAPSITLTYTVPAVESGKALWVKFPYGS